MATNNRPLKAYVRFDGSGRAVSSSLIWRKNKPKVGKWKEVQGYECCNTDECSCTSTTRTLSYTLTNAPQASIGFFIECPIKSTLIDDGGFMQEWINNNGNNVDALATYLNLFYPMFGTWIASEGGSFGVITLKMNSCVAGLCSEQDMNFGILVPV
jgi:hypothetical protein